MHWLEAEACVLWPANYKPEIFPLECSSGLLLLKPKPPPLCGLLEDPVFVFPEVMGPRCKLLYLWRQSLFLGRNLTLLERGRTCCLQGNTVLPLNGTMTGFADQSSGLSQHRTPTETISYNTSPFCFTNFQISEKGKFLILYFWSLKCAFLKFESANKFKTVE